MELFFPSNSWLEWLSSEKRLVNWKNARFLACVNNQTKEKALEVFCCCLILTNRCVLLSKILKNNVMSILFTDSSQLWPHVCPKIFDLILDKTDAWWYCVIYRKTNTKMLSKQPFKDYWFETRKLLISFAVTSIQNEIRWQDRQQACQIYCSVPDPVCY